MPEVSRRRLVQGAAAGIVSVAGIGLFGWSEAVADTVNGFSVKSPVLELWRANRSALGLPVSRLYSVVGGHKQRFQRGDIYFSSSTPAAMITGRLKSTFDALRGSIALGIPVGSEVRVGALGSTQKTASARLYQLRGMTTVVQDDATARMPNVPNFRDAAGEQGDVSISTGLMRRGVLYRSGRLQNMRDFDTLVFQTLGIASVIELRQAGAASSRPDPLLPGVTRVQAGVSADTDYVKYVTDPKRRLQWAKGLRYLANTSAPAVVHCHSGKDRTGWFVAQLHYLLGADDQTVMTEFLKSNDYIGETGVSARQLKASVQQVKKSYGSMGRYFTRGLGLTNSEIARLRRRFAS